MRRNKINNLFAMVSALTIYSPFEAQEERLALTKVQYLGSLPFRRRLVNPEPGQWERGTDADDLIFGIAAG